MVEKTVVSNNFLSKTRNSEKGMKYIIFHSRKLFFIFVLTPTFIKKKLKASSLVSRGFATISGDSGFIPQSILEFICLNHVSIERLGCRTCHHPANSLKPQLYQYKTRIMKDKHSSSLFLIKT